MFKPGWSTKRSIQKFMSSRREKRKGRAAVASAAGGRYREGMIEELERRQLLTTLVGGGVGQVATYFFRTNGTAFTEGTGPNARIDIYGDVTAEFIFIQSNAGGQVIRTLLQRRFGFETNGVGFYLFAEIAKPKLFKDTYREQLDAIRWTEAEQDRVVDEARRAFRHNAEMFADLATATAVAA